MCIGSGVMPKPRASVTHSATPKGRRQLCQSANPVKTQDNCLPLAVPRQPRVVVKEDLVVPSEPRQMHGPTNECNDCKHDDDQICKSRTTLRIRTIRSEGGRLHGASLYRMRFRDGHRCSSPLVAILLSRLSLPSDEPACVSKSSARRGCWSGVYSAWAFQRRLRRYMRARMARSTPPATPHL
jgi:hypothetical protein